MLIDGVDLVEGSKIKEVIIREERRGLGFPGTPTVGNRYFITETFTDGSTTYEPGTYEYSAEKGWFKPNPKDSLTPYDIAGSNGGTLTEDSIVTQCIIPRKLTFSSNFEGSQAYAETPPAAQTQLNILKNSTVIGNITFEAASNVGTFTGSETTFYPGDIFKVVAPAGVDSTISDLVYTLAGSSF